ncbi:MAG: hypothetical protein HQL99_05140 [Magnetococcales bacterium]|nr:hypothetical protein [Magnetococcales bacterium]
MQFISFYSFKGGVGRTNALLNVAWILARRKYFVVVVDMDLHAPGLTLMPEMASSETGESSGLGLIDFLADVFNPHSEMVLDLKSLTHRPRLVPGQEDKAFKGDLLFLPCARMGDQDADERYRSKLRHLPLNALNDLRETGRNTAVIDEIRAQLATLTSDRLPGRTPDFLFLDARTGFTEIGDLIIGGGSDHVVALLALNEQNRRGLEFLLSELLNERDYPINELPSRLTILVGPVPDGEEKLKQEAMDRIQGTLSRFARHDSTTDTPEVMPKPIAIPYHPILALTEQIIARDYPQSRPALAYRELAEVLERRVIPVAESKVRIVAESKARMASLLPVEQESGTDGLIPEDVLVHKGERKGKSRHPLGRAIPWNLLSPGKTWRDLLSGFPQDALPRLDPDALLNQLAVSAMSIPEKQYLLQKIPAYSGEELGSLKESLQVEQEGFLQFPEEQWSDLARDVGFRLGEWFVLLQEIAIPVDCLLLKNKSDRDRLHGMVDFQLFWFGWAEVLSGKARWQDMLIVSEVGMALFPQSGKMHWMVGRARESLEDYENAEIFYKSSLSIFEQEDDHFAIAWVKSGLGNVLMQLDRLVESESVLRSAFDMTVDKEYQSVLKFVSILYGLLLVELRKLKKSEELLSKSLKITIKHDPYEIVICGVLVYIYILSNDAKLASESLERVRRLNEKQNDPFIRASIYYADGEILLLRGFFEDSKQRLDLAGDEYKRLGNTSGRVLVLSAKARLALAEGDPDSARRLFQEARELAVEKKLPLRIRKLDEEMARVLPN